MRSGRWLTSPGWRTGFGGSDLQEVSELFVDSGKRLLQHLPVGGTRGALQISQDPRTREFQRPAALKLIALVPRQGSARRPGSCCFFLLRFHLFALKASGHLTILALRLAEPPI